MSNNTETFIIKLKDQFSTAITKAGDKSDKTKHKVEGLSGAFGKLRNVLGGVSIAFLGREIVNSLAEFEKFEAVLTNTLGSNSAAQKAMSEINDFAAKTPFAVDKLTGAYVKLTNQGFQPTLTEMRKLGDLASSTGKDFDQLAEAVIDGQVGEFERLKEFGIRAKKSGDSVAFTFKGVTKEVAFTEKAMQGYILSLGDVQGVSGSMAAISKTTGGQISNLGDQVTQLYIKIGQKLKGAINGSLDGFGNMIGFISETVDWLAEGGDGVDALVISIGMVTGAFVAFKVAMAATSIVAKIVSISQIALAASSATAGVALGGLSTWTKIVTIAQWGWNAALSANPIGLVVIAIGALVGGLVMAWQRSETFRGVIMGVWAVLKAVGSFIADIFAPQIAMLGSMFDFVKDNIFDRVGEIKDFIVSTFSSIMRFISPVLEILGKPITAAFDAVSDSGLVDKLGDVFGQAFDAEADPKKKGGYSTFMDYKLNDVDPITGESRSATTTEKKKKGLGSGVSEIKSSAPKNFNINIDSLVKELTVSTTNLRESSSKIREEITKALLTAVNDSQVIAQ